MKLLFVFACIAVVAVSATSLIDVEVPHKITSEVAENLFSEFIRFNAKNYQSEVEQSYRLKVFTDNLHLIAKHNKEAAKGKHSYTLGITSFTDLTAEEFAQQYTMQDFDLENATRLSDDDDDDDDDDNSNPDEEVNVDAPTSIDWRTRKCVGAVRNQGGCGSCWAFAAAALIEGAYAQKTGKLFDVSEQQIVDCDTVSYGCNGGWTDAGLRSVIAKGGIQAESSYPYCACSGAGRCRYNPAYRVATVASVTTVVAGGPNENAILNAVAYRCGVSVYIHASTSQFQMYKSGVFDYSACPTSINHAVAVVGYGTESGKPFWLVRNSWGSGWGAGGYIKMVRNKNVCGIGRYAYYANA